MSPGDPSTQPGAASRPSQLGPFHVLDVIGEGGMGTVYLAEQKQPIRRRAAVKVIKLGMDSKAVLARFEAERKALSLMEHSCIAQVYDAGLTASGQPWFAMEYVKGIPITDYCDQNKLALEDRIALFQMVCSGVQHAHLKGVMHRDLKPGNVLVTVKDGKPQPKIIDFGLAKATNQQLVEATIYTEQGQFVGTPEYMSPEQAGLGGLDVDTRTDVYSLGVLLYELLTGELPFPQKDLRAAGYMEMQRVIREQEPPKPSTRVTSLGERAAGLAQLRALDRRDFARMLRGDLDWITLKALEKDRTRRYDTAQELAADLSRYLKVEPVLASPPSPGYRARKFVRKYRAQCVAALVVLLAIVGGGVGIWLQSVEAQEQRDRADEQARLANEGRDRSKLLAEQFRPWELLKCRSLLPQLTDAAVRLGGPWSSELPALEAWVAQAKQVLELEPQVRAELVKLRAKALPPTEAELAVDRRTHPRVKDLEELGNQAKFLQQALAYADGTEQLEDPELSAEQQEMMPADLLDLAWKRVAPWAGEREQHGEEALGLALARLAEAKARAFPERHEFLHVLAWACAVTGRPDEAEQVAADAVAAAPIDQRVRYERYLEELRAFRSSLRDRAAAAQAAAAACAAEVKAQRTFRYEDAGLSYLDRELSTVQQDFALFQREFELVERRRTWASQYSELSRAHPKSRHTWKAVRDAIALADDVVASKGYAGKAMSLADEQVAGLVPIGMNPLTRLWEFYDLFSAWDGVCDPAALQIPQHGTDGSLPVSGDMGVVLVLLPGGSFWMGAQKDAPQGRNFHKDADGPEHPVHKVNLSPFFVGRYEVTQGQWLRWTGRNTSRSRTRGDLTLPVDRVSWYAADRVSRQGGLALPTEAQWEYACRAGTSTPWWTGPDESRLKEGAVFSDRSVAPVGTKRHNAFGLFDTAGNVQEWCRDQDRPYQSAEVTDPSGGVGPARQVRGGGWNDPPAECRSAVRELQSTEEQDTDDLGFRVVRDLAPVK